jgi:ribosomal protein S1
VDRDEVLLDIGYKTEGVIPSKELSIKHDVDPFEVVNVGDEIEALVQQKEDKEGRLILSKKRAQYERAWGTIEQIKEEDGVVTGTVIEVVKGGLIVDIGLRGFLPASLVEMRRVRDLQPYVGQEIEAKIIELDKNNGIKKGDIIRLTDKTGQTVCYRYDHDTKVMVKDYNPNSNILYDNNGPAQAAIVICWDYVKKTGEFDSRVIFYAYPVA